MLGKLRILFWIGILLLFVPYLGVKNGPKTMLTIVLGVLIAWLSLRLKKDYKAIRFKLKRFETPESTPEISVVAK